MRVFRSAIAWSRQTNAVTFPVASIENPTTSSLSSFSYAHQSNRRIGIGLDSRLDVDREQIVADRLSMSLSQVAKRHAISRASVCRFMKMFNGNPDPVGSGLQQ
jgi:hypothetical protein